MVDRGDGALPQKVLREGVGQMEFLDIVEGVL